MLQTIQRSIDSAITDASTTAAAVHTSTRQHGLERLRRFFTLEQNRHPSLPYLHRSTDLVNAQVTARLTTNLRCHCGRQRSAVKCPPSATWVQNRGLSLEGVGGNREMRGRRRGCPLTQARMERCLGEYCLNNYVRELALPIRAFQRTLEKVMRWLKGGRCTMMDYRAYTGLPVFPRLILSLLERPAIATARESWTTSMRPPWLDHMHRTGNCYHGSESGH